MLTIFELDGSRIDSLEHFYEEVSRVVVGDAPWGHNLDAFNDILRGGFGTPEDGFVLRWLRHRVSQVHLSYPETIRQLEQRLRRCHPTSRQAVLEDLRRAQQGEGSTVFDWVLEIIRDHGPGRTQAHDNVILELH